MDVGGGDEPLVDRLGGLGPKPPARPVDGPPGVEGGHAAAAWGSGSEHTDYL